MTELHPEKHTILGYVGPQVASSGVRCVHLYPEMGHEGSGNIGKYRACTVYEERFGELPYKIGDEMMSGEIIMGTAPEAPAAKRMGIFFECPRFDIETYHKPDGSNTKKLARVIETSPISSSPNNTPASHSLIQTSERLEFNPISPGVVRKQVLEIALETKEKMSAVMSVATDLLGVQVGEGIDAEMFRLFWNDVNAQFRMVRPHLLVPAAEGAGGARPQASVILNGRRETFLEDVARQHPLFEGDTKHVVNTLKLFDITQSGETGEERLAQAKLAWMYADIISEPYNLPEDEAVDAILAVAPAFALLTQDV